MSVKYMLVVEDAQNMTNLISIDASIVIHMGIAIKTAKISPRALNVQVSTRILNVKPQIFKIV